jgi:hypothetical protein
LWLAGLDMLDRGAVSLSQLMKKTADIFWFAKFT